MFWSSAPVSLAIWSKLSFETTGDDLNRRDSETAQALGFTIIFCQLSRLDLDMSMRNEPSIVVGTESIIPSSFVSVSTQPETWATNHCSFPILDTRSLGL